MIEVRIHGRGGQGNVVAAYLLAGAAVHEGLWAQAFPAFGAERRGAPVRAFVRVRGRPILRRNEVAAPDLLVVQDPTLLNDPTTVAGLKDGGAALINSGRSERLAKAPAIARLAVLPATAIAEHEVGRAVPNVPLLAALAALTGIISLDALARAIDERFAPALAEANHRAMTAAAARVTAGAWKEYADAARH